MKFIVFVVILFSFISFSVYAQKPNKDLIKGDERFSLGEYFKAIKYYEKALKKSKDKAEKPVIFFQIAECYRFVNNPSKAESYYKKSISTGCEYPEVYLYLADMKKKNKKCGDAIADYAKYNEIMPGDQRGINGAKSCELAQQWIDNPTRYQVVEVKELNSKQSDFCPSFSLNDPGTVYFTSSRQGTTGGQFNYVSGMFFTDLYTSSFSKKGEWSKPEALLIPLNTEHDEGAVSLDRDGNMMYFTSCKVVNKEKMGCQLFSAKKSGDSWSEPTRVPLGSDSISYKHPSLSEDGLTLYFTAEMEGGYGKNDIWKTSRASISKDFGKPENMGSEINTPGNEQFPFIRYDSVFFFSSDYHVGMGGLDIFRATMNDSGKWVIKNLKFPVNSFDDDFGIVFQRTKDITEEKGLFSSTRKGKGNDDIYSFYLPPIELYLKGSVKDLDTDSILRGAVIKLIGSDGLILKLESDAQGVFKYKLKYNTDYVYLVRKEGYLNGKGKVTTMDIEQNRDFLSEILLTPITRPVEVEDINYDLDKWELREESKTALNKLVEILNDNPTIVIELSSHTDIRGTVEHNLELSQKRAQAVVDFLIQKGIPSERLIPKGYGSEKPRKINKIQAKKCSFREGDILSGDYINKLANEKIREEAHQINRRTEFSVVSSDYGLKKGK